MPLKSLKFAVCEKFLTFATRNRSYERLHLQRYMQGNILNKNL